VLGAWFHLVMMKRSSDQTAEVADLLLAAAGQHLQALRVIGREAELRLIMHDTREIAREWGDAKRTAPRGRAVLALVSADLDGRVT
jgi:hypothetical protein